LKLHKKKLLLQQLREAQEDVEEIEERVLGGTAKLWLEIGTLKQIKSFVLGDYIIIFLLFLFRHSTYENDSLQS
jgi:hypothetical protein